MRQPYFRELKRVLLFRSGPHGEHCVYLVDDPDIPHNRIYDIVDLNGRTVSFLGSEIESLSHWWLTERNKRGGRLPEPAFVPPRGRRYR